MTINPIPAHRRRSNAKSLRITITQAFAWVIGFLLVSALSLNEWSGNNASARTRRPSDGRVHLVHADKLHTDQYSQPDVQILNGNVHFTHGGTRLYCDSAYFYESTNSFRAFGHVKMYQGDTLSLFSDYAYYDGNDELAIARHNVVLKHRKTTLYTDSLNYDKAYGIGYFFDGGRLVDKQNTLVADWGQYDTETKQSVFKYDVHLKNKTTDVVTDTLYYNTSNSMAEMCGPTDITQKDSHIYTEHGFYNTQTDQSELYDRTVITNKDGKKLMGDSVYHDSETGISRAYHNVVYSDSKNKNQLTGNVCYYDDKQGYAYATDNAVAIDYSQADTLYVHADTFKLYTFNINTDSMYRRIHAYNHVRAYRRDVQAVCDSMVYISCDSCATMYHDPIIWHDGQQLLGEEIKIYNNDSTVEWAHVINQALSVEKLQQDTAKFNQIASKEMKAFFRGGEIYESQAIDNVLTCYYVIDDKDSSIISFNYLETSLMKMFLENRKLQKIWTPEFEGVMYPLTQIPTGKDRLPSFAWFDYIRPIDKNDIFEWRSKGEEQKLKTLVRHAAPKNNLTGLKHQ